MAQEMGHPAMFSVGFEDAPLDERPYARQVERGTAPQSSWWLVTDIPHVPCGITMNHLAMLRQQVMLLPAHQPACDRCSQWRRGDEAFGYEWYQGSISAARRGHSIVAAAMGRFVGARHVADQEATRTVTEDHTSDRVTCLVPSTPLCVLDGTFLSRGATAVIYPGIWCTSHGEQSRRTVWGGFCPE